MRSSQENLADANDPSSVAEGEASTGLAGAAHEPVAAVTEGNEIQVTEGLEKKFKSNSGSLANVSSTNLSASTLSVQLPEGTLAGALQNEKQMENKMVDSNTSGEVASTGPVETEINAPESVVNVSKLKPQVSVKPRKRSTNQKEPVESSTADTQATEKLVQNVDADRDKASAKPRKRNTSRKASKLSQESSMTTTRTMSMTEELSKKVKDLHTGPSKKVSAKPKKRSNASKGPATPPAEQETSTVPIPATSMAEELKDVHACPSKEVSTKQRGRSTSRKRSEILPSAKQETRMDTPQTTTLAEELSKKLKDVHRPNKEASKPGRNPTSCMKELEKITYHDTAAELESVLQSIEKQCKEMALVTEQNPKPHQATHGNDPSPSLISPIKPMLTTGNKGQTTIAPHLVTSPAETKAGKDSIATNMKDRAESFSMLGGAVYTYLPSIPKLEDKTEQLACINNTTPTGKVPLQPLNPLELSGKWGELPAENNRKATLESLRKTNINTSQRMDSRAEDAVLYDTLEPHKFKGQSVDVVYNTLEPLGTAEPNKKDSTLLGKRIRVIGIHNIALESSPKLEPKLGAAKSCDELNSLHYAVSKPHQAGQATPSQQEKGAAQVTGTLKGSKRTLGNSVSDTYLQGKSSSQTAKTKDLVKMAPENQVPPLEPYKLPEQKDFEPIYSQPVKVRTKSGPKKNLKKLSPPSNQETGLAESSNSKDHVYNTLEPPPPDHSTRSPAQGEGIVPNTKQLSAGKAKTDRGQSNTASEPVYAKPIPKLKRLGKASTTTTTTPIEMQPSGSSTSIEHVYNILEPSTPPARAAADDRKKEGDHEYAILEPPANTTLT